ncbi:MAG: DUF4157 domain-containing protein [Dehalococcoidia bacterium]
MRIPIPPDTRQWLALNGLVNPEVDLQNVRLHHGGPLTWYLAATRHGAITFGNHIFYRKRERMEKRDLLVHELVHVAQYRRIGMLRFHARYLRDALRSIRTTGKAYGRDLPLEKPAYDTQALALKVIRGEAGVAMVTLPDIFGGAPPSPVDRPPMA